MSNNPFNELIPHELCIQVKPGGAPDLVKAIDSVLNFGWSRNLDAEKKSELRPLHRGRITCYQCDNREGRPAALVSLFLWLDDLLTGATVPLSGNPEELSTKQRNAVLLDFHDKILCELPPKLPPDSCLRFSIRVADGTKSES